jgi:hypothetical protein
MGEMIGIREAARRLGVSDTAVHKAIKAGRASLAGRHATNGRPLVSWPEIERDWHANSDSSKRTHVGPQGNSPRRAEYGGNAQPAAPLSTSNEDSTSSGGGGAPSIAQSRAIKEAFLARQAKLDYERAIGKVIDADAVKVSAFKLARQIRDSLLNIPDRVSAELAAETNAAKIHARLHREVREALAALSGA